MFFTGLTIKFSKNNRIKDNFKSFEKTLNKWFSWCANNNISPIKASLDFVRAQHKIDYLIVGFDNVNELRDLKRKFRTKKVFVPNIFTSNNINLIDPRKWYK